MKVLLIALNAKYIHSNLAVYNLKAYADKKIKEEGLNDISVVVREYTINNNLDRILQSIYREKADVTAFSCYIWNIKESLSVACGLSKVLPETEIWLGGPEVCFNAEEVLAKNPFITGIMTGEGEQTFYELLKVWGNGDEISEGYGKINYDEISKKYAKINGITFLNSYGEIITTPERAPMPMDEVPFIYDDLSLFENRILYYETSRGCPFSCSYCLSSIDKSLRFRSLDLVESELKFFLDNKVKQVKFIDRTFNCNREHALAIWRYIAEHDNGVTNFHFEISADLLKDEELALFKTMRKGLIQLEIGLQSTNPDTIREIRRHMDVNKLKENMLAINEYGNIHQHLDLIAGLPYEDFVTFKQSFNDAYAMKPDQLQLGFLKILKGSYMEEKVSDYEIEYSSAPPYEVLKTKWIDYDEIIALKNVEEMLEIFHNSGQFAESLPYIVPFFETPFSFYESLAKFCENKNESFMIVKREQRYADLFYFCKEHLDNCDEFSAVILKELLKKDYCKGLRDRRYLAKASFIDDMN